MPVALHPNRSETSQSALIPGRAVAVKEPESQVHLVIFTLGDECYGVDIGDVWEINTMQKITRVPRSPHFIEGVINLRGEIVPVMDLRKRLGLPARSVGQSSRIMVTKTSHNRLGLIVDSVREVLKLPVNAIKPAAELGALIDEEFVRGVAQRDDQLIVLIDLQRLFDDDENEALEKMDAAASPNSSPSPDARHGG